MTRPLSTGKKAVNLAERNARGSRIRRDPPLAVKQIVAADRDREERDRMAAAVGIPAFALAIFIIVIGFSDYLG